MIDLFFCMMVAFSLVVLSVLSIEFYYKVTRKFGENEK